MERKTITIEEIEANLNLDLNERINKFAKDEKWSEEDLKELALSSIKQEYEFWINRIDNKSSRTDEMLTKILNGHILSKSEEFEMLCDDEEKVKQYTQYTYLKECIKNNNGITLEDLEELCQTIGFDPIIKEKIIDGFQCRGLIIDAYQDKESYHR